MSYSFSRNEQGWVQLTVPNPSPSDKGLIPTEVENILNQLQEELFGGIKENKYKLKIEISPKLSRKLDDTVIDFIKKQEERYKWLKRDKRNQPNYEYYALTLYALQKLGYKDKAGKLVNQIGLAKAIGIRRPTLSSYFGKLQDVEKNATYLEIERDLFNL